MLLLYSTENMNGKCVGSIDANVNKGFPGICLKMDLLVLVFQITLNHGILLLIQTFNRTLIYEIGAARGKEFHYKGVTIALSPWFNFLRNPSGGRVWEVLVKILF